MLRTGLAFFVLALLAYVLGATGVVSVAIEIGRVFLITFLGFSVLGVVLDLVRGGRPKSLHKLDQKKTRTHRARAFESLQFLKHLRRF